MPARADLTTNSVTPSTSASDAELLAILADPADERIPEPLHGQPGPQTNDIDVDKRGIIYVVDRGPGFNILEFNRK